MRRILTGTLALTACLLLGAGSASARPAYRMAFMKAYEIKPTSTLGKAGCNICHMGADKKTRNAYGVELEKALGKVNASQDEAAAALKKIEDKTSADKKTKYIELIKADKLPGEAK